MTAISTEIAPVVVSDCGVYVWAGDVKPNSFWVVLAKLNPGELTD